MAGHNKWSKIKNTKGVLDAKRGKIFTKITKEITVAARLGGGNPDMNARLRLAVLAAKDASMPKENIERAIKKGTGELEGAAIEEITYEGYGPGGIAILVETTSDNKNRTVSDLRNLFKSGGGHIGESGSVAWMFNHLGHLHFSANQYPEDKIMEVALEVGAQDIQNKADGSVEVLTSVSDLYKVRDAFEKSHLAPQESGFIYVPKTTVSLDKAKAEQLLKLLENLEDHDDVQRVHACCDIDDKILSELHSQ